MPSRALLVFSHLRWNFVYQRPQHLLARLGRDYRVLYVEEPTHHDGERHLEVIETDCGVTVCRPHLPSLRRSAPRARLAQLACALRAALPADRAGLSLPGRGRE